MTKLNVVWQSKDNANGCCYLSCCIGSARWSSIYRHVRRSCKATFKKFNSTRLKLVAHVLYDGLFTSSIKCEAPHDGRMMTYNFTSTRDRGSLMPFIIIFNRPWRQMYDSVHLACAPENDLPFCDQIPNWDAAFYLATSPIPGNLQACSPTRGLATTTNVLDRWSMISLIRSDPLATRPFVYNGQR